VRLRPRVEVTSSWEDSREQKLLAGALLRHRTHTMLELLIWKTLVLLNKLLRYSRLIIKYHSKVQIHLYQMDCIIVLSYWHGANLPDPCAVRHKI
jgi:hypothetical protein